MKNNAKKFPLPTGDKWARLPERVEALENAPKAPTKKLFEATIFQEGTADPNVNEFLGNTTGANFTFKYRGTGEYSIESNIPLFSSREKVIVTLSLGKNPLIANYNYIDEKRIDISTFAINGSREDGLLVDNKLTIEILD